MTPNISEQAWVLFLLNETAVCSLYASNHSILIFGAILEPLASEQSTLCAILMIFTPKYTLLGPKIGVNMPIFRHNVRETPKTHMKPYLSRLVSIYGICWNTLESHVVSKKILL